MTKDAHSHFSRYARHFFSGTLLSRASGMVRDVAMAAVFGDHPSVAAFMVAFRFSHFLRRLLGEGPLQSIFIPQYQELKLQDEKKASAFFFKISLFLTILTVAIILFVSISTGFISSSENEVAGLFVRMFPSLLFISLYGINLSLLQCKNAFFSSSAAPFACNAIWILAVFLFANKDPKDAMLYLSTFTLIGFIIQWMITLPGIRSVLQEGKQHASGSFFSMPTEVKSIGKATIFGIIGITAVQINSFLDMLFARCADVKGPVYLWYAIRLYQLPLAIIGLACVYSVTPTLSKYIKENSFDKARSLFSFGHKRIFLLLIPSTFAIFALGFSSVDLLFGRGQFSLSAVTETTLCLQAYAIGLLSATLTVYQSSLFYAYGDYKTPTFASFISVGINIILNALFVFCFHFEAVSIALATALSSWVNYLFLKKRFLQNRDLTVDYSFAPLFIKVTLLSSVACISCFVLDSLLFSSLSRSLIQQLLRFSINGSIFVTVFILSALYFGKEILLEIKNYLFTKKVSLPSNL